MKLNISLSENILSWNICVNLFKQLHIRIVYSFSLQVFSEFHLLIPSRFLGGNRLCFKC